MNASPLLATATLPETVVIGGGEWPIRHDFRDGIRFEMLLYDKRVPQESLLPFALDIWFETVPCADTGAVIDAMLTFHRCGKPPVSEGDGEQLYSYEHDYDLIYAGFLNAYGIDLLEPTTMLHWWKFRAMLAALPDDCQLMRVIGYRAATVESWMSKEQKLHVRKMRRLWALPQSASMRPVALRTEEEYRAALAAIKAAKLAAIAERSGPA